MRNVPRIAVLLLAVAILAACQKNQADQNIVITNEIPANAQIETLPADESSATPSDELVNGSEAPDEDVNASNSY